MSAKVFSQNNTILICVYILIKEYIENMLAVNRIFQDTDILCNCLAESSGFEVELVNFFPIFSMTRGHME